MRAVVTADESCMHNYNMSFMAGFLSCVPKDVLPEIVVNYIEKKFFSEVPNKNGTADVAILALRKLEACLSAYGFDVTVAVPQQADKFDADLYLVSTMDPFGVGPATTTMVGLTGGKMPFNKFFFQRLVTKIRSRHPDAKIIVGGPGAWEFELFQEEIEKLGINCVFNGAVESAPSSFWTHEIFNGVPKYYKPPAASIRPDPYPIKGPSFWGMVEISRGCGRGCQFCDFELMSGFKWLPKDFIVGEAKLNAASPLVEHITLLSEDTLRYGTPAGSWKPTGEVVELVKELAKLGKKIGLTHCCLATALANPKVTEEFSYCAGFDEKHLSGFQTGIESGSPKIVGRYMKGKILPWKADDWCEVVEQGMAIMVDNFIIPHGTLVMGLPEETPDDTLKTIELVDSLKNYPSVILPLFYVPLSIIKGNFFLSDMMTPEQKELVMVASRHTARWSHHLPNWSGTLGFVDKFTFTAGAEYSFKYLESLSRNGKSKKMVRMLVEAATAGAWNLIKNNGHKLEYFENSKKHYPVVEKILRYEEEKKQKIVVVNNSIANVKINGSGCGCGMAGAALLSANVAESLYEKQFEKSNF